MSDTTVLHSLTSSCPTHRPAGAWLLLIVAGCAIGTTAVMAQVAPPLAPTTPPSPTEAHTVFTEGKYPEPGAKRTTIYYSRPAIRAATGQVRKIWGGLVPWDKMWRLGAN